MTTPAVPYSYLFTSGLHRPWPGQCANYHALSMHRTRQSFGFIAKHRINILLYAQAMLSSSPPISTATRRSFWMYICFDFIRKERRRRVYGANDHNTNALCAVRDVFCVCLCVCMFFVHNFIQSRKVCGAPFAKRTDRIARCSPYALHKYRWKNEKEKRTPKIHQISRSCDYANEIPIFLNENVNIY